MKKKQKLQNSFFFLENCNKSRAIIKYYINDVFVTIYWWFLKITQIDIRIKIDMYVKNDR